MQFTTNSEKKPIPDSESDPQVVEKLYFHEVQGRRYLGSRAFLESVDCQFAIRLMLVASEPLRILTFKWLSNLEFSKADTRCPLHTLFDPNENSVNVLCLEKLSYGWEWLRKSTVSLGTHMSYFQWLVLLVFGPSSTCTSRSHVFVCMDLQTSCGLLGGVSMATSDHFRPPS